MLDFDVQWLGLSDFPNVPEVSEDGRTFAENARKKAAGYAKATGLWTIADDSGLVIDALDGAPGVRSARFSKPLPQRHQDTKKKKIKVDTQAPPLSERRATPQDALRRSDSTGRLTAERRTIDHKNMAKVLKLLEGVPKEKRAARFVCRLCLASPEKILAETEGKLEGLIAESQIGENGFGYDPIFFVPKLNRTVAQLTRKEKNAVSHRGNAIRQLKHFLQQHL